MTYFEHSKRPRLNLILIRFFIVCLPLYVLAQDDQSRIDSLITEINSSLDREEFSNAIYLLSDLGRLYEESGFYSEAIVYYDSALTISQRIGDQEGMGRNFSNLGWAYKGLGDYNTAIVYFDSALYVSRILDDRSIEGVILANLGDTYYALAQYSAAIESYFAGLNVVQRTDDQKNREILFGKLGGSYDAAHQYDRALACFDSALSIAQQVSDRRNEGAWLGNKAKIYIKIKQYDMAKTHLRNALIIAREVEDQYNESVYLEDLGTLHYQMFQFPQARLYYDSSRAVAHSIGDRYGERTTLRLLGKAYYALGQFDRALAHYDSALAITREIGDRKYENRLLGNIGRCYQSLHQYRQAVSYLDSARIAAKENGDIEGEVLHLDNLSQVYKAQGEYVQAIQCLNTALLITRELGDEEQEGSFLSRIGLIYNLQGQYSHSILYLDSALTIAQSASNRRKEMERLSHLGGTYFAVGHYEKAITYYKSALSIARQLGDDKNEGIQLGHLGVVYINLYRYPAAISYLDSALSRAKQISDKKDQETWLGNLGVVYSSLNQPFKALAYLKDALKISRDIDNQRNEAFHLGNIGRVYSTLGFYSRTVAYADSALRIAEAIGDKEILWQQYWSLADAYSKIPDADEAVALEFYDKFMKEMESVELGLVKDSFLKSYFEDREWLYRNYIDYLLSLNTPNYNQRALKISERARARAFMELIARRFHGSEVEQKKELLAPANFSQIQYTAKRLDTSILEYFISDSSLVVWLVKPDGEMYAKSVPIQISHLDSLVVFSYYALNQIVDIPDSNRAIKAPSFLSRTVGIELELSEINFQSYLSELYQTLFPEDILSHLPKARGSKLLLVPHRHLAVIPFIALKDSVGHYLLETYSVHQVPGIGVLLQTGEIKKARGTIEKPKGDEVLLFGNPKMPAWSDGKLYPLPGAEAEVKAIARHLRSNFDTGLEASEYRFKQEAQSKLLIHLATHGISFDASPLESFVALTSGQGENGLLTAAEILEMQFQADLVVLSACQTGLGKISGDGIEGLLRVFLVAGVPSVLVSLWNVDDRATKELMLAFYDQLSKGMDKAEALRQAQLKLMKNKEWSHPKFWAAFVLYGER